MFTAIAIVHISVYVTNMAFTVPAPGTSRYAFAAIAGRRYRSLQPISAQRRLCCCTSRI